MPPFAQPLPRHATARLTNRNEVDPGPVPREQGYDIRVKTLIGMSITVQAGPRSAGWRVAHIKEQIQKLERLPIDRQRIIFAGQVFGDVTFTEDAGIRAGSTVHLVLNEGARNKPPRLQWYLATTPPGWDPRFEFES